MIKTVRKLYNNIKTSLFFKNMLMYSAISIIPTVLLVFVISNSISSIIIDNEIVKNSMVAYNVNNFLEQKYNLVYKLIRQTYTDINTVPAVTYFIENSLEPSSLEYLNSKKTFDSYFYSFFSSDADLRNIFIYKMIDNNTTLISKNYQKIFYESEMNFSEFKDHLIEPSPKIRIYPAHASEYFEDQQVYSLSINIKSINTFDNTGILRLDFSTDGIINMLDEINNNYYPGTLYILTSDGKVIYDSSGNYDGENFPYFYLSDISTPFHKINEEEYIVHSNSQDRSGLIILSLVPTSVVLEDLNNIKETIIFVTIICIILIIFFTLLSTRSFLSRINIIINSMKKVWTGDLNSRINVDGSNDEISNIALNFNKMCDNLTQHISKVYLSEIKQKNAQINSLQSQINPHFLYNTLESIRMSALANGDKDTSRMIYILAKLFRNTIKEKSVILFSQEIENIELYLQLFKIKFRSNFTYEYCIDNQTKSYGIIKNIIQPLVENYIVHGYDIKKENNHIKISSFLSDDKITIIIEDNGSGISNNDLIQLKMELNNFDINATSSIGLRNSNERIKLLYGNQYGIELDSIEGVGTTVKIIVPAKSREELLSCIKL